MASYTTEGVNPSPTSTASTDANRHSVADEMEYVRFANLLKTLVRSAEEVNPNFGSEVSARNLVAAVLATAGIGLGRLAKSCHMSPSLGTVERISRLIKSQIPAAVPPETPARPMTPRAGAPRTRAATKVGQSEPGRTSTKGRRAVSQPAAKTAPKGQSQSAGRAAPPKPAPPAVPTASAGKGAEPSPKEAVLLGTSKVPLKRAIDKLRVAFRTKSGKELLAAVREKHPQWSPSAENLRKYLRGISKTLRPKDPADSWLEWAKIAENLADKDWYALFAQGVAQSNAATANRSRRGSKPETRADTAVAALPLEGGDGMDTTPPVGEVVELSKSLPPPLSDASTSNTTVASSNSPLPKRGRAARPRCGWFVTNRSGFECSRVVSDQELSGLKTRQDLANLAWQLVVNSHPAGPASLTDSLQGPGNESYEGPLSNREDWSGLGIAVANVNSKLCTIHCVVEDARSPVHPPLFGFAVILVRKHKGLKKNLLLAGSKSDLENDAALIVAAGIPLKVTLKPEDVEVRWRPVPTGGPRPEREEGDSRRRKRPKSQPPPKG